MMPERHCRLDTGLYPSQAVQSAVQQFEPLCGIRLNTTDEATDVTLDLPPDAPPETVDEFLHLVLCAALEIHLSDS
jgi:hypothetical protein